LMYAILPLGFTQDIGSCRRLKTHKTTDLPVHCYWIIIQASSYCSSCRHAVARIARGAFPTYSYTFLLTAVIVETCIHIRIKLETVCYRNSIQDVMRCVSHGIIPFAKTELNILWQSSNSSNLCLKQTFTNNRTREQRYFTCSSGDREGYHVQLRNKTWRTDDRLLLH
jgi:hypothetical protein